MIIVAAGQFAVDADDDKRAGLNRDDQGHAGAIGAELRHMLGDGSIVWRSSSRMASSDVVSARSRTAPGVTPSRTLVRSGSSGEFRPTLVMAAARPPRRFAWSTDRDHAG
jgi:hypothetical protein